MEQKASSFKKQIIDYRGEKTSRPTGQGLSDGCFWEYRFERGNCGIDRQFCPGRNGPACPSARVSPFPPSVETREQQTQGRGAQGRGSAPPSPPQPADGASAVASHRTRAAVGTGGPLAGVDCRQVINALKATATTPAPPALPFARTLSWDGACQSLFPNCSFFMVKGYFPQAASRDFIV